MKIELRPLPREKWHGKKGKEDFSRPNSIEALYDNETGNYATGLTEEERTQYEAILKVDLSNTWNPEEPHPFWSTNRAKVKLENFTTFFNTEKPIEFIHWKILKASKYVANNLMDFEKGLFPFATHYIFSEEEDVQRKASRAEIVDACYAAKLTMTAETKINIIQVLTNRIVRYQSSDYINVKLQELIEERPREFYDTTKFDNDVLFSQSIILEAIDKNILQRDGTAITFAGSTIGNSMDEAVKWFLAPERQGQKAIIMSKLRPTDRNVVSTERPIVAATPGTTATPIANVPIAQQVQDFAPITEPVTQTVATQTV
jgi:hypothetical protein